jgi:hypothetical protein
MDPFEFICESLTFFFNDFTVYLIYEFLLWNANLVYDTYLSFLYKKIYVLLSIQILLVYSQALELRIRCFFVLRNI